MWRNCSRVRAWAAVLVIVVLAAGAPASRAQNFELTEDQFDSWVTNGNGSAIERIEAQLAVQMSGLKRTCALSPEQDRKLRLAAAYDIERFQARLAEVHDRLVGKTYDQNQINEVWMQIQPLQEELPRVLGPQSLFNKVMRRTLEEGQLAGFDLVQAERAQYRYQAKVQLFVTAFDRAAPMTEQQRIKLYRLIVETTRRPQRFGQYDWYYVLVQASKTPDAKYAEILEPPQVKALRRALQQGRHYEQTLQQEGCVPFEGRDPLAVEAEAAADDSSDGDELVQGDAS
jgi:hypothetical protein